MPANLVRSGVAVLAAAGVVAATALIAVNSAGYYAQSGRHPFLTERPELAVDAVWRAALLTHVTGGLLCLAVGPVLVWNFALRRSAALHRVLGRAYVVAVLAWAGPTGLWLSLHAKGGLAGRAGFLAVGIAWIVTTSLGWRDVRRGRLTPHARWMVRSYALALSAVHFRVVQTALFAMDVPDATSYVAAIWLSLLASVVQGELLAAQIGRHGHVTSLLFPGGPRETVPRPVPARRRALLRGVRHDGTRSAADVASPA